MIKPPADPPSIKSYRTYTICTQFVVIASDSTSDCQVQKPPTDHIINVNFKGVSVLSYSLSSTDLLNSWLYSMGHLDNKNAAKFEVAIVKACAWGPLPQQLSTSLTLNVNSGAAQRTVVDHGSPMSRPRCGISIPKLTWGSSGQVVQFGITPSILGDVKKGSILGVVHVTLSGRMKGSF